MKVLIIGSGGREHALCLACKKSTKVEEIFCIPGNAGTDTIAKNFEVDIKNFRKIKEFLLDEKKFSSRKKKIFREIHTGKLNPETGIHFLYENLLLIFRSL